MLRTDADFNDVLSQAENCVNKFILWRASIQPTPQLVVFTESPDENAFPSTKS